MIYTGTSGWNYPHWKGIFYPEGLARDKWLEYYAGFFNSVELNVTFYRLVPGKTFQAWRRKTPRKFYFVAKGSRFITHIKRLNAVKAPLGLFMKNALGLKEKLAAVLWQLPSSFKKDSRRLESFLKLLKNFKSRQVFEFRSETWFDKETYSLLKEYNACLCIADSAGFPCAKEITSDFIYLRFHGSQSLYSSDYSDKELRQWADFAKSSGAKDIFAFFNNDACGYAIKNAPAFRDFLNK